MKLELSREEMIKQLEAYVSGIFGGQPVSYTGRPYYSTFPAEAEFEIGKAPEAEEEV